MLGLRCCVTLVRYLPCSFFRFIAVVSYKLRCSHDTKSHAPARRCNCQLAQKIALQDEICTWLHMSFKKADPWHALCDVAAFLGFAYGSHKPGKIPDLQKRKLDSKYKFHTWLAHPWSRFRLHGALDNIEGIPGNCKQICLDTSDHTHIPSPTTGLFTLVEIWRRLVEQQVRPGKDDEIVANILTLLIESDHLSTFSQFEKSPGGHGVASKTVFGVLQLKLCCVLQCRRKILCVCFA